MSAKHIPRKTFTESELSGEFDHAYEGSNGKLKYNAHGLKIMDLMDDGYVHCSSGKGDPIVCWSGCLIPITETTKGG